MGYMKIPNLYKEKDVLLFKEVWAMEKIHGTSAHVSYNEGKLGFFSGGENYQNFLTLFNHDELLEKFNTKFGKATIAGAVIVFGEAYGNKQQRMGDVYGPNLKFVAFDVKVGESWLSVPIAHHICKDLGLDFVYYEKVSTDLTELDRVRDMHSMQAIKNGMGEGKESEGVVLRPLIEVRKNNGERIIAKHKRAKFRETATIRKVDEPEKLKIFEDANAIAEEWCVAHRLEHILGKMQEPSIKQMKDIIGAMQLDIQKEAEGEIVWNEDVCKAIGRKTAYLAKKYFISQLKEV